MPEPSFAVVGHPNKGKSSLVATLCRDANVHISATPGTTSSAMRYPMRLGGRTLYTLIDTPGFQRPRAVLDWLTRHESGAASRPATVARFVAQHQGTNQFADECQLLGPLVDAHAPAAIIYVVDGAKPYGSEFEAEMEVLRWTGRPSLAVINPIGSDGKAAYEAQWRDALGQFFKVVRVVDVLHAPFRQQVDLLQAFALLDEAWRPAIDEAVAALTHDRQVKRADAAQVISELIASILTHQEVKDIARDADPTKPAAALEERYRGRLRQMEREARAAVERLYAHESLQREETDVELLDADLLSKEAWLAFGLKRRDLMAAGAVSGAVAGSVVDAAMLGSSFLTGTVIGGALGGALGYFTSDKLAEVKVLRQPLGGQRLRIGPTGNAQFLFVLLARGVHHHALVAGRTHARRDALRVASSEEAGRLNPLSEAQRRSLARLFARLRKSAAASPGRAALLAELAAQVQPLLHDDPR